MQNMFVKMFMLINVLHKGVHSTPVFKSVALRLKLTIPFLIPYGQFALQTVATMLRTRKITHPCPNLNGRLNDSPLKLGHGSVITSHCFTWK